MIPFFQSEFDALQVLYNRFGEIPPTGDFGYFWWLFWLKNPIFRRDFEIGHNLGVSAYFPMPKNRKSSFGQAPAQNRAHINSVILKSCHGIMKVFQLVLSAKNSADFNSIS